MVLVFLLAIDGKFGTDFFAELTADAGRRVYNYGRVISFLIELLRQFQNPSGAECHTEAATLAPAGDYVDFSRRHLFPLPIEGLPPHSWGHGVVPVIRFLKFISPDSFPANLTLNPGRQYYRDQPVIATENIRRTG
jgi:hypothetical protein